MLRKLIRELNEIPTYSDQIEQFGIPVLHLEDMDDMEIGKLRKMFESGVVLYLPKGGDDGVGHYIYALSPDPSTLYVFDSYGVPMSEIFSEDKEENASIVDGLLEMYNRIEYNKEELQKGKEAATCASWCMAAHIFLEILGVGLDKFVEMFNRDSHDLTSDDVVSLMTIFR